jgi:hypothetical protein
MSEVNMMMLADIRNGALLTWRSRCIVGATSTALAQASDVVDRSDELVALDRMGCRAGGGRRRPPPPGADAAPGHAADLAGARGPGRICPP